MSPKFPFGAPAGAALGADFAAALELERRGRFMEAEGACRAILMRQPGHFEAAMLLGLILLRTGRFEAAERQFAAAAARRPEIAVAHANRALALHELRRWDESLAAFDLALRLHAGHAETHLARGNLLQDMGRAEEAVASYGHAIALRPDLPGAYYNRGLALYSLKQLEAALADYDRALGLKPDSATLNNRGNVLRELGRAGDALASYERAIAIKPDFADAWYNRGGALFELDRPHDAIASYDRAIALDPDAARARFSRGLAKLALGRLSEAWEDFEKRWLVPGIASPRPALDAPEWHGEDIAGKSILVFAERGFGDIIQFCRYLPLVAARGAKVHFLVRRNLHRLMASLPGDIHLHDALARDARFDVQCALMSLPARFGTTIETIPTSVPYLAAEVARVAEWKARIEPRGFKIGIAWRGASWQGGTAIAARHFPLAAAAALARIPGVRLISLQKGDGTEELRALPPGLPVETPAGLDEGPDAFADTAAVMQALDLVVSCDTAIVHVAGALARPCWVALNRLAEWRWLLEGERSPWYPTLRLFRQTTPGDWDGVFAAMAAGLKSVASRAP
jgi:tetratricopeptide (TPR) repeat protein